MDESNNIYAAGGVFGSVYELTNSLCVKYNSSGSQLWVQTWNNSSYNLNDAAVFVLCQQGLFALLIATQVSINPVSWRLSGKIYSTDNGSWMIDILTDPTSAVFTEVRDIVRDDSLSIYVCGTTTQTGQGKNIHVAKYNLLLGEQWTYTKNGSASGNDEGIGIGIAVSDTNVFVSGYISATGEGKNVYAAKLGQSSGAVGWETNYHLAGGDDEATGLKLDSNNNLIIPCTVDRNNTKDIGILKLNTGTGNLITQSYYNSETNRNDYARDIAVNTTNNDVYVSAQVQVNDSTYESRIVKWKQTKVYSPVPTDGYSSYSGYIPNRMQLRATDSTANRTVLFYNQANRVATYIDNSKISYQLLLANDTTNADTTYCVNMVFAGGKGNARVYPYHERKEYHNYYLGHMDKPSVRTPLSNVILKQNVYDYTDVLFTSSPMGFRHWFVARTGATPASYQMAFTGQTSLSVDSVGNLVIATTIGDIVYKKAKAYSMNNSTGELTLLGWQPSYSISDSTTVKFTGIGSWSGTLVLEVDEKTEPVASVVPESNKNMDWSTFIGGLGINIIYGVDNDSNGNVWYCGETNGLISIHSPGENPGPYSYNTDAFVIHFNSACEAEWITYYGGSKTDNAHSIAIDPDKNSYCVGRATSSIIQNGSPHGIDDNTLGGSADGFFLKLNSDGEIEVDSYIGGDGIDIAYDVAYRPASEFFEPAVFIVGECRNTGTDFPILSSGNPNGYDQAYAGGAYDGFLMELSPEGTLRWSTFLGSSSNDKLYAVEDIGGYPVVLGYTTANEYTEDTPCAVPSDGKFPFCAGSNSWYQEAFSGAKYFMARFNKNREMIYSTFSGNAYDLASNGIDNGLTEINITTYPRPYGIGEKHCFYIYAISYTSNAGNVPFLQWTGTNYPNPYYGDLTTYTGNSRFRWIAKFYVEDQTTSLVGSTLLNWNASASNYPNIQNGINDIKYLNIAADKYDGLIVTGGAYINQVQDSAFCQNPDPGDFPICDAGGQLYMEDNLIQYSVRSFILHFDAQMNIVWSTLFGAGYSISAANGHTCVSSSGDYIFCGGWGVNIYTLWEYDEESEEDYFRPLTNTPTTDAVAARFRLPQSVIVNNEEIKQRDQRGLSIFPNSASQDISILLPPFAHAGDIIEVYDVYGRLVMRQKAGKSNGIVLLNVGNWASGMYIVKYTNGSQLLTQSFIKQ